MKLFCTQRVIELEELFDYSVVRFFDFRSDLLEVDWSPIISGYSVLQSFGSDFRSFLTVMDSPSSSYRIFLSGLISLHFGSKLCLRCFSELSKDSSDPYCSSCYSSSETSYRLCLFHSPKSVFSHPCSPSSPACGDLSNVSKCFSRYYLYFGRFGDSIKVGISRLYYGKFKFSRIIQQGLNEAIVIYPFSSLVEVTAFERFLIDEIGIQERFSFREKVDNLLSFTSTHLSDYYPLNQIRELFPDRTIKHFNLFPDNPLEHVISSSLDIEVLSVVDDLVGNVIYTQGNVGVLKQYNRLIFFDLSKLTGRLISGGPEW